MNRVTIRTAILLASLSPLALTTPAAAQDAPAEPTDATASKTATTDENGEEIVVTGTRRIDRTSTNSASPIDVISSAELTTQPTANMMDTVKSIVPSFFVGQN